MKESLESARNIHQIFIIGCAVILIYTVSLRPNKSYYDDALSELNKLEQVLDSVRSFRIALAKSEAQKQVSQENIETFTIRVLHDTQVTELSNYYLQDILDLIDSHWHSLDSTTVLIPTDSTVQMIANGKLRYTIYLEYIPLPVNLFKKFTDVDGKWVEKSIYHPKASYMENFENLQLVSLSREKETFIQNLKTVLPKLQNQTIKTARIVLSKLAEESSSKSDAEIDVTGLKVAGRLMYIIGPSILTMLMLYLIALVRHLNNILVIKEQADVVSEFPWLGIFSDISSRILTALSLSIFPIAVVVGIVTRSELSSNAKLVWTIMYLLLLGSISYFLLKSLLVLQKKVAHITKK